MIRGYVRVSTEGQRDNNSIESQTEQLKAKGAEKIYVDVMSGATMDRPELNNLLGDLQKGDTFMVCKLDRLSRTATQGFELVQSLLKRDISVNVLNMGQIDNTPTGTLILQVFLAFSEFERSTIRARMMEGKEIARKDPNFREGRPNKYTKKQINHALKLLETMSYTQVSETTGISVSTLARAARKAKAEKS